MEVRAVVTAAVMVAEVVVDAVAMAAEVVVDAVAAVVAETAEVMVAEAAETANQRICLHNLNGALRDSAPFIFSLLNLRRRDAFLARKLTGM